MGTQTRPEVSACRHDSCVLVAAEHEVQRVAGATQRHRDDDGGRSGLGAEARRHGTTTPAHGSSVVCRTVTQRTYPRSRRWHREPESPP